MGLATQSARRSLARIGHEPTAIRRIPVDVRQIGRRLGCDLSSGTRINLARLVAYRLGFQGSAIAEFAGELTMPEATVRHLVVAEGLATSEIADLLGVETHDVAARIAGLGLAPAPSEAVAA